MILKGERPILGLSGNRVYSISFPKEWAISRGLQFGEKIDYIADEVIVIIPKHAKIDKELLEKAIKRKEEGEII